MSFCGAQADTCTYARRKTTGTELVQSIYLLAEPHSEVDFTINLNKTMASDSPRRLKVALLGLGRLGQIRARTLAFQQPRIELVAVCDTKPGIHEWVNNNLPPRVRCFADPFICMKDSGAEAVLISTPTATHAALIHQGFDLGLVSHLKRSHERCCS